MRNKISALIGVMAICTAMLPTDALGYWANGYEVLVNGNSIGIVENELEVSSMLAIVNHQLTSAYDEEAAVNPDIQLRAKLVTSEKLLDKQTLHDEIASCSDKMTEATRITIDGAESICVADSNAVTESVQLVTEALGIEDGQSDVVELVGYYDQLAPEVSVLSAEEAADYLINEKLLTVYTSVTDVTEESYIPTPEEYTDETLYEGVKVTTDKGVAGSTTVTTVSSYVNGELTNTTVSSEITDYGTPAKVAVGTKPRPAGVGSGTFMIPTNGRLSSPFGMRWGRMHNGIDLAASVGTPIYAADEGTVICSEYKGSFGNLVQIDHGNGYTTYYAHNSENLVSVGQTVAKGDLIAKIGSTGRSTGPHLHFEIRYDDVPQDPMNYLK